MSILQPYNWKKISQKLLFLSIKKDHEHITTQIWYICLKSISIEMMCKTPYSWNASKRTHYKMFYNQRLYSSSFNHHKYSRELSKMTQYPDARICQVTLCTSIFFLKAFLGVFLSLPGPRSSLRSRGSCANTRKKKKKKGPCLKHFDFHHQSALRSWLFTSYNY